MLESINVRFFAYTRAPLAFDLVEIDHAEFVELYAEAPSAIIDIEKHSIFANGVRQLCITVNVDRASGEAI